MDSDFLDIKGQRQPNQQQRKRTTESTTKKSITKLSSTEEIKRVWSHQRNKATTTGNEQLML